MKGRIDGQGLMDTQCCFEESLCCHLCDAHNYLLRGRTVLMSAKLHVCMVVQQYGSSCRACRHSSVIINTSRTNSRSIKSELHH
jgi:hypothetical protein